MALLNNESKRAWVSFKDFEWLECEVQDSTDTEISIKVGDSAALQKVKRKDVKFHYRNPSAVEKEDDFLKLPQLDEPNILHSLRVRYWAKEVYSYTGPILIAVNPWAKRDIYSPTLMEQYKSGKLHRPHIFDIATKAFQALQNDRKSQCVLISGESGSGKTESTKYVLQVLTAASDNRTGTSASIEQQVMLTNPVLEAFGNAKTLRNDNSSRFGKWISVHFERKGTVVGAEIKTYLLEKARVVHQGEGERNYHIFYQVCECASSDKILSDLSIESATHFDIVKTTLKANNTDDTKNFSSTKQAMEFIGFDKECQTNIFKVLAAILHAGNMSFGADKDGNATLDENKHLHTVSKLLSIEESGIRQSLCFKKISAGGEFLDKPETKDKAMQSRDALSKALYSKVFDFVVVRVNEALKLQAKGTLQVSVLDIFGFEIFPKNYFEQFCINHANEKLQLHFNHYNFMLERKLYETEGIELVESDFQDNAACLELLEAKGWGIQATLDDVCLMPKGDDETLLNRLNTANQIKNSPYFVVSKQRTDTFTINHYAGTVSYTVEGFCDKNKDQLPNDIVDLIKASKNPFFGQLFDDIATDAPSTGKKGGKAKSLSLKFKEDLASLMEAINQADPHFVRCVNPNGQKKAECFDDKKAIEQLRCGGVIEAVRMCRESYPSRFKHDEFVNVFSCLLQGGVQGSDARSKCVNMATTLQFDPKHYRLGKSMILLKREVIDRLEKMRSQMLGGRARSLQLAVRRYIARQELGKKREDKRKYFSVVLAQAVLRRHHTRDKYVRMILAVRASQGGKSVESSMEEMKQTTVVTASLKTVAKSSREAVLANLGSGVDSEEDENEGKLTSTMEGEMESPKEAKKLKKSKKDKLIAKSNGGTSPLCIRIQVHAEGITEALLFHVDLLATAIKQAVRISDHKTFLRTHPNTFRGTAATEWLRRHAGRALFGQNADKEKNQSLAWSVALLLAQKLLAVGVYRQVTGSMTKPFEDPNALFRFHEDEKEGPLLNCRSIWFQNAREPLFVVSELLYLMLQLRVKNPGKDLREVSDFDKFSAATGELQLVCINDLTRLELLAFFLNVYNLIVLHAHVVRGYLDGCDFRQLKFNFVRENQYMIAAYNYSLAEIEERLFCRALRAKFPKKSEKARAPEARVHFALSLGCASSPNIRIYQPETLDEDLQNAATVYLQANAPKNQVAIKQGKAASGNAEMTLPKVFKWFQDDFGFSKQEILSYYASFMPASLRDDVLEVARNGNFQIRYEPYDWNLYLTKACSEINIRMHHDANLRMQVACSPQRRAILAAPSSRKKHRRSKTSSEDQGVGERCTETTEFTRSPHEAGKKMLDVKLKQTEEEIADQSKRSSMSDQGSANSSPAKSAGNSSPLPKALPKALGEAATEGFLC